MYMCVLCAHIYLCAHVTVGACARSVDGCLLCPRVCCEACIVPADAKELADLNGQRGHHIQIADSNEDSTITSARTCRQAARHMDADMVAGIPTATMEPPPHPDPHGVPPGPHVAHLALSLLGSERRPPTVPPTARALDDEDAHVHVVVAEHHVSHRRQGKQRAARQQRRSEHPRGRAGSRRKALHLLQQ